ncbi:group II intron reverse transcriptase/maturase [Iodobacter fluviatilis]|uniref:Group II intron-encoded protein ltrA n=1 Tax=Iodobacter fluviatilis TaxID=537 RepID=A0A377Q5T0_9NEIS|nr:group II intron reverse transcriptase/maturase [Iodobacter fluviatilis]TCU81240.1 RNA-directed DNA polymerase [Iodobacter fluviatilis]STQ90118.1 Group II intron-encoded protein ltrA [Iodobacter fluviatilis]STQ91755.1 Group II intron-encoded protein ltrA [Iodobacter fluviatilis]
MTKPYDIPKALIWGAFQRVKANGGAAGVDQESIAQFESNLSDNLYKLWNRLGSGSYFPPAVKGVAIPKKSGGVRMLGIPTVADRVAQTAAKLLLEPELDPLFHPNSYGYRPGRSAHDAIALVRRRNWEYDWVLEFDIKGLFDNIDHDLLLRALKKHCKTPWILLYVERWLKAPMQTADGQILARTRGTPQGGVVSPLLANLFLHYAFDVWVKQHLRSVRICRYADDGVVHCKSLAQAQFALDKIGERFRQCGLELHPEKTKIVYCQDINRQQAFDCVQFTFLGYTFRPRKAVDKYGRVYVNFSPAVSRDALKAMRQTIRGWHLQLKCDCKLDDLSAMFNTVLRGWQRYYGRFYASAMSAIWKHMNSYLVRWLMRKYKHLARHKTRAWRALGRLAQAFPNAFVHWEMGFVPKAG